MTLRGLVLSVVWLIGLLRGARAIPEIAVWPFQSHRKAIIGSTFVARRAGT